MPHIFKGQDFYHIPRTEETTYVDWEGQKVMVSLPMPSAGLKNSGVQSVTLSEQSDALDSWSEKCR